MALVLASIRHPAVLVLAAGIVLAGCATGPIDRGPPPGADIARRAADVALAQLGEPYRYGGEGPAGFDCSGLVHYAYARAGHDVPRTARGQYEAVHPLYLEQLIPGDVIFFRTSGVLVSHVGIYIGNDRFVHALNAESPVRTSSLKRRYWRTRVIRAGSLTR